MVLMAVSCQKSDFEETEVEHQLPNPEVVYVVDCEWWGLNVGDTCWVDFGGEGEVSGTMTPDCECDVAPPCNLTAEASSTVEIDSLSGAVTVNTTGGFGPLSFTWSMGQTTVGQSQNLEGLIPGEYAVLVTDTAGCVASDSVLLEGNAPLGALLIAQLINNTPEVIPVSVYFSEPALPMENTTIMAPPGLIGVQFSLPFGTTQCVVLFTSECNGESLVQPIVVNGTPLGSAIVDEVIEVSVGCPGVVDLIGGGD